ncbi:protein ecdysoneless [Condylostylus longicornis]|uniref:protein ecdysoneless n=1 Tax=Condylostylus longicornis TaxID=2530218 RepID=UPI00244E3BAF|nr:protein ecdysoneless [Condylostylus longicornis]
MVELVREEDFVEYFLFPQISNGFKDAEDTRNYLNNILKEINSIADSISQEYIWHKDSFRLNIRTDDNAQLLLTQEGDEIKQKLPPHLYGISYYGENIQDEWFIVYLLSEITKKVPGVIARVVDSDGEFLLIEAADVLPKWASPDTCEGRVFIFNGKIHVVQNSPSNSKSALPSSVAITKIWSNPALYQVSTEIQNAVEERFKEFKEESFKNLFHNQIVRVSIGVAALLKEDPSLISSSVRSFCERDSLDMKACKAMRYFPPEDRVRTSIRFTKCLYAMLSHCNYVPDQRIGWQLPPSGTKEYKEDLLGIKIASGFEILASQGKKVSNSEDIENESNWKTYINNLKRKGYFKEFIENSQDYVSLLNEAKRFYKENRDQFNSRPNVGQKILKLLNNIDVNTMEQLKKEENSLKKSDSDDWLNISSEELNEMLISKYGIKKLYQANGNINANEFTKNIGEFLEKRSEYDGVEIETDKNKDVSNKNTSPKSSKKVEESSSSSSNKRDSNQINFDPDAFSTHIKNFLDFVIPEDNWESNSEMSDYEDEDDLEKNLEDMVNDNAKVNLESYFKNYTEQMDKELANTNVGKTFNTSKQQDSKDDDFDDIESFEPIDINVNTLKSMMDSYKSQIGGTGPVSTLLNAMGVGIEKAEETQNNSADLTETQV